MSQEMFSLQRAKSDTLHPVLERILHLGEAQFNTGRTKRFIECRNGIGRRDINARDRFRGDDEPMDRSRRFRNGIQYALISHGGG